MLSIKEYDHHNNYRKLHNDPMLFHNALKAVIKGESRFHIEDDEMMFDLVYEENDIRTKNDPCFPDSDFYHSEMFFPPYFYYDEEDKAKLNLEPFKGFEEIFFEEVNEYSVVLAYVLEKYTDLNISFMNSDIHYFPWLKKAKYKEKPESDNCIYVQSSFYPIYVTKDRFCTTGLFHCVFMLQWLTDLPKDKIKYLSFSIRKTEGIGSIMTTYSKLSQALKRFNIEVFIEPNCTRFSSELLSKYFVFGSVPENSNEDNTIYAHCFNSLILNYFVDQYDTKIDLSMLQPKFVEEMKEYTDSVMGDKKVLGVLLRGTDYIIANFAGSYHPVTIDESVDVVKEYLDKYSYDKIFVATEDETFLEKMLETFPGKILAVSQERYKVADFNNLKYISELEKKQNTGDAYNASVEDTTVNYFYAMYMLSRCESFISNCMCSGVNIVSSFNDGKFVRNEILSETLNSGE